ncbi:MAG: hypothetical protein ABI852_12060, partial [Gemmatimonadaceae bacterium]
MSTSRRDFLNWVGVSSALAATASFAKTEALAAQQAKPAEGSKWDMSWTDRVNGKYKAVFDGPSMSEGGAMFRACIWRDQHKDVYGTERKDASAVLVLRHAAIELIMNDKYWDRFEVGKTEKWKDSKGKKWIKTNPIGSADPAMTGAFKEYNLADFMKSGGIVLACNMAFSSVIANYRKKDKLSQADGTKAAKEDIIPGIILQPSGIFAAL